MAEIYFSDKDRTEVYRLPVLPSTFPEINRSAKNEEFETFNNGVYNIPGNMGLATFELGGFLPALDKNYSWIKEKINPYLLINLWVGSMAKKIPIRIIMNRAANLQLPIEAVNMLVTVENISYYEDRLHDVQYKISLKEYRDVTE